METLSPDMWIRQETHYLCKSLSPNPPLHQPRKTDASGQKREPRFNQSTLRAAARKRRVIRRNPQSRTTERAFCGPATKLHHIKRIPQPRLVERTLSGAAARKHQRRRKTQPRLDQRKFPRSVEIRHDSAKFRNPWFSSCYGTFQYSRRFTILRPGRNRDFSGR